MSVGGFIAQATLGGAAAVGKGIGDQIRADAELKRKKALADHQKLNAMEVNSHQAVLANGNANLEAERQAARDKRQHGYRTEEIKAQGEESRKSIVTWKDVKDEKTGKVLGQKASNGQFIPAKPPGLSAAAEKQYDTLNDEAKHLWDMEAALRTGKTDGMVVNFGDTTTQVTTENRGEVLADIRERLKLNEQRRNQLLGATAPANFDQMLAEASKIPPERRAQELADLKADPKVPYSVVSQIETLWATDQPGADPSAETQVAGQGGATEPVTTPAPGGTAEAATTPTPQPDPEPTPATPTGAGQTPGGHGAGMMTQAQAEDQGDKAKLGMDKRLLPQVGAGARLIGRAIDREGEVEVLEATQELARIASGESEPYQGNIRQFLINNPEALRRLPPDALAKLKARYTDAFINQFLK